MWRTLRRVMDFFRRNLPKMALPTQRTPDRSDPVEAAGKQWSATDSNEAVCDGHNMAAR